MKIGLVCQYFPPEIAPIGVMLSELAQDLTRAGHEVTVFTGYPNHPQGRLFETYTRRLFGECERTAGGYFIRRSWLHVGPPASRAHRILNYLSFAVSVGVACLSHRQDIYLIVSPPLSNAWLGAILALAGLRYVFNVQDIYPDAAIATGILRNRGIIAPMRALEWLGYRLACRVTVISEGFRRALFAKGVPERKLIVIPNWIDLDEISPRSRANPFTIAQGLEDKFTVLYSGTIGLVSGAEIVIGLAAALERESNVVVMMVGEGVVKSRIEQEAKAKGLTGLRFAPFQPREALPDLLASASVGLVTLKPGHGGNSVPSKILGYMAAARPVIVSVDPDSDTWQLVDDAECGLCVPPGDPLALAEAVKRLAANSEVAARLGGNGRRYLERRLSRASITARYEEAFRQWS